MEVFLDLDDLSIPRTGFELKIDGIGDIKIRSTGLTFEKRRD
ncbi:hypothetical protein [Piscirickettsia litoralis]|nr:hypothetical protein [Piscirickettsia litoralis]